MFRVIIAGSRQFNDYEFLAKTVDYYLSGKEASEIVIISGHAKGADSLGEKYAMERGYKVELYPADWDIHGKAAGFIRNTKMAEVANALIAFRVVGYRCNGTNHMIGEASKKGLLVRIIDYDKKQIYTQ